MSDFLENLKKAADNGEFNSEAAKKILEVNELAEKKLAGANSPEDLEKLKTSLIERAKADEVEETKDLKAIPSEEEVLELNSEYEKKMEQIKKLDIVNAQLATLIEIEDMVVLSIEDMFSFVTELDNRFTLEFEEKNPIFDNLYQKIEEIKLKYKSFINK